MKVGVRDDRKESELVRLGVFWGVKGDMETPCQQQSWRTAGEESALIWRFSAVC